MQWKAAAGALLVAMTLAAGAHQARADDDCASFYGTCLREAFSRNGTSRELTVSLLRQHSTIVHYNVIVQGGSQIEVDAGDGFRMTIPEDGKAIYSVQSCANAMLPTNYVCKSWQQIVRIFPPLSTCNDYTNAAVASIVEAQRLGCGFGGGRWNPDSQAHLHACLDQGAGFQSFLDTEATLRAGDLTTCKDNIAAASKPPKPVKTTGRAKDGSDASRPANGGYLTCAGGGMSVEQKKDSVFVNFAPARQAADRAAPEPGQCAWSDRVVGPEESRRIAFTASKDNADELIEAARNGGTFVVAAIPMKQFMMVNAIVEVEDLNSGPAAAEDEPAEEEQPPAPEAGVSADCPAGVATVSTASVGEDVLNVRATPSASAEVVTQVPDGSEVNVVGACLSGAGFAKGKTLKPKGEGGKAKPGKAAQASAGWCRIDEPAQGCVKAEFLAFGDAPKGMGGAGLARTLKPKDEGGDAKKKSNQQPTFAGNWSVSGDDDVTYSMSMKQNGSSVSGSYKGGDGSKGTFKGKLKGNVLRFTWKQADGYSGSGKFALADDGSSFDGSYNFGSNADEVEGSWNGTRN
jgi:hypothetical protein